MRIEVGEGLPLPWELVDQERIQSAHSTKNYRQINLHKPFVICVLFVLIIKKVSELCLSAIFRLYVLYAIKINS